MQIKLRYMVRHIFLTLLISLISFYAIAQDNCCQSLSGGYSNYQPTEEDATLMRFYFDSIYTKDNKILRDSFWISGSFWKEIANVLGENPNICGYRFSYYTDPWWKKGLTLAITPTTKDSLYEEKLGKWFCRHKKNIGVSYNMKKRRFERRGRRFHKKFKEYYASDTTCSNSLTCLSKSVWFDKCVIEKVAKDLDSIGGSGVAVFSAAYPDWQRELVDNQSAKHQSSFILAITRTDDITSYVWQKSRKVYVDTPDSDKKIQSEALASSAASIYNHGELCPQKCPDRKSNRK